MSDRVNLTGKTISGRNRIKKHGYSWIVVSVRKDEGKMLLQSRETQTTRRDLLWVDLVDDVDFHIQKQTLFDYEDGGEE